MINRRVHCAVKMAPRAFTLAALLFACACTKSPTDARSLNGTIVSRNVPSAMTSSGVWVGSLLVKDNASEECGVVWGVSLDTKLRKRTGYSATTSATFDEFVVGAKVRVTSTGIIAESCPAQGTATEIELQ